MASSIDILRSLSSRSNVSAMPLLGSQGDGVAHPTADGKGISWKRSDPGLRDAALNEDLLSSMGAGASVRALRQSLDEGRMQHATDQRIHDDDLATNGLRRAMTGANIQNEVSGFLQEGAARNATQPFTQQATEDAQARKLAQIAAQAAARPKPAPQIFYGDDGRPHALDFSSGAAVDMPLPGSFTGKTELKAPERIKQEKSAAAAGTAAGKAEGQPSQIMDALRSVFGGGPSQAPSGGTIRARDPLGNVHELTAGAALPAGWTIEK